MHPSAGIVVFSREPPMRPSIELFNHHSQGTDGKVAAPWIDLWKARGHDVRPLYTTSFGYQSCLNVNLKELSTVVTDVIAQMQKKFNSN